MSDDLQRRPAELRQISSAVDEALTLLERVDEVCAAYEKLREPKPEGNAPHLPELLAACRNLADFRGRR